MPSQQVKDLMNLVNSSFKTNVLHTADDPMYVVEYMPTGCLPIDIILRGGLARGRFHEIYGDSSTLKSFIGYSAIAAAQARGETAALIDLEHAFDPAWATAIGVDVPNLIMGKRGEMETGEQAFDFVEALIRAKCNLIVFDSIGAMLSDKHRMKRLFNEDQKIAANASLMSAAMRKTTAPNTITAMLFINQLRTNVGQTYGDPNVPTGGKALPFYASARISVKKIGKVTEDIQGWNGDKLAPTKSMIGQQYKATVEKSKLNIPHRDLSFEWSLAHGAMDLAKFVIGQGMEHGFITLKGNTWETSTGAKAVGKAKFAALIANDDALLLDLVTETLAAHNLMTELDAAFYPGRSAIAVPSKAAKSKPSNSASMAQKPRPTAAAVRSSRTAQPKTISSSSNSQVKAIRSAPKVLTRSSGKPLKRAGA